MDSSSKNTPSAFPAIHTDRSWEKPGLAARAAIRVWPALLSLKLVQRSEMNLKDLVTAICRLPLMRLAGVNPKQVDDVRSAALTARGSSSAADAAESASDAAEYSAAAVAYPAYSAATTATEAAAAYANDAAAAAAYSAADDPYTDTHSYAAEASKAAFFASHQAFQTDISDLAECRSLSEFLAIPFWPESPPSWNAVLKKWIAFTTELGVPELAERYDQAMNKGIDWAEWQLWSAGKLDPRFPELDLSPTAASLRLHALASARPDAFGALLLKDPGMTTDDHSLKLLNSIELAKPSRPPSALWQAWIETVQLPTVRGVWKKAQTSDPSLTGKVST